VPLNFQKMRSIPKMCLEIKNLHGFPFPSDTKHQEDYINVVGKGFGINLNLPPSVKCEQILSKLNNIKERMDELKIILEIPQNATVLDIFANAREQFITGYERDDLYPVPFWERNNIEDIENDSLYNGFVGLHSMILPSRET